MASPPNLQNLHIDSPADAATDNTHSSSARVTFTPNTQSMALSPTSISLALKSPEGIDCYGNERQALAEQSKFFNNSLLSDVNLVVAGQRYYAHKIVLVRASDVFERMFSSEWSNSGKKEVELVEDSICNTVFPRFLKFLYGCHIKLNIDNTLPVLILADKYNVEDLRNVCITFAVSYIIPKLQLKDVFHVWFQYSTKCYHQRLVTACVGALAEKMDEIIGSEEWEAEWLNLEKDQLIEFLRSSDLSVKDEFELWEATVKWIQSQAHPQRMAEMSNLAKVMEYIRFPMMTSEQLCEVESSSLYQQHPELFQKAFMLAYKFHALPLTKRANVKEFMTSSFLLRNYTDLRWDKRLQVSHYSACPKGAEVGFRFSTRASSFPAQTWEWELKVHPKGYSAQCDDFRVVLYSNLILDQPRPIEYYLSIVDRDQILHTVSGKKNFSKARYTTDTEMDKKVTVADLCQPDSPLLVDDHLILQIALKPVE
ncbi:BTB/POZ domain-containing protein 17-like [Haliotis asinina]|uniref:BTB/POZ domain-containing protein 17-like n=1 Tax=Haliotis asinina TaxID=109174 RepID=UPI003531D5DF